MKILAFLFGSYSRTSGPAHESIREQLTAICLSWPPCAALLIAFLLT